MKTIQIGDVVGEYKVIDTAGAGGMGKVYKIEHVITHRIEAMKLLPSGTSSDPEQVLRFEREIQLQARLHHPNIVTLYTAVRDGNAFALIMEFVEGQSLQQRLEAGALPVPTAVNLAIQLLGALEYAHKAGVIHRDVTPANIIITKEMEAKLTDFGLAFSTKDPRLSASGIPLGSPCYMSPEQIKGTNDLEASTDIYAMGAVLHEMLTGKKLFEVDGAFALMRAHVETEPQMPSSINPTVPTALDHIVGTAVAKNPAMRFQSADEFRLSLQRLAVDLETVPARLDRKKRQTIFPRLQLHLQELRAPRTLMVIALAPTLLAGFYAVKLYPYSGRSRPNEITSGRATPSQRDPITTPENPQISVVADSAKMDAGNESHAVVLRLAESSPKVVPQTSQVDRRARSDARDAALQPIAPGPSRGGDSVPSLEPPKSAKVESAGEQQVSSLTATSPERQMIGEEAAAPKLHDRVLADSQTNNRFLRMLGKVNPFRRWIKRDTAKSEPD